MKTIAYDIKLQYNQFKQPEIVLLVKGNVQQEVKDFQELITKGKTLNIEIKKHSNRRSLDSNAYCFVLCQKIAEVIHSTKEEVYQKFIKQVGQFEVMPIKDTAVKRWINIWESKGLGWISEVLEDSKLEGYKKVISYYGSSVYDQREMSILVDEIVTQCKDMDIETMSNRELSLLNEKWGK